MIFVMFPRLCAEGEKVFSELEKDIFMFPRLRAEGEKVFSELEKDIEARCRGYVEYAGQQCQVRSSAWNKLFKQ